MDQVTVKLAENSPIGREGESIRLALTPSDVHVPEELATYLAGYKPFGFRADEMSPIVPVDHSTDYYRTASDDDAFEPANVKTGIDGYVSEVSPRSSTTSYTVGYRVIGSFVNDIIAQNATGRYQPRQAAMKRCQNIMTLDREIDVITSLTTTTSFAATQRKALGAGFEWNDGASSNPIKDLQEREEASDQEVTEIWMSQQLANVFLRHPAVRDHLRMMLGDGSPDSRLAEVNKQGGATTKRDFEIPGLPPIRISASRKRNATTGVKEFIWPIGTVVLVTNPPGIPVDGETIATAKTFRMRGSAGVGFETREYRVENRGPKGGTMVVCYQADVHVVTGPGCGGIITGAFV
jgi:hypothetical protein